MITWYNKYTGLIDDPATAKQAVKDLQTALKGKQLVLYGAGVIGSEVTKAFKRVGIQPAYILDADYRNIGHVGGFAVHSPALLKEIPLQDTLAFGTVGELTVEAIRQD